MRLRQVGSNMTEIEVNGARVLFSYETPVAAWVRGELVKTAKFHSTTTSRHVNKWFAEVWNRDPKDVREVGQEALDGLLSVTVNAVAVSPAAAPGESTPYRVLKLEEENGKEQEK